MMEIKKSPNYAVGTIPKIGFIIHGTLGNYEGAIQWLCTPPEKRTPVSYSSAHYVIAKDGRCTKLVEEKDVAWHAGTISNPTEYAKSVLPKTILGSYKNPNESFIGIELEWFVGDVVTQQQYDAVWNIITNSKIANPIILCHKEVTDFKADFTKTNGMNTFYDPTVVDTLRKRLKDSQIVTLSRDEKKAQIIKLIQEL